MRWISLLMHLLSCGDCERVESTQSCDICWQLGVALQLIEVRL